MIALHDAGVTHHSTSVSSVPPSRRSATSTSTPQCRWTPPKQINNNRLDSYGQQPSHTKEITYRALLGNFPSPLNPLRCISHIDIDSAYAAMESVRLGIPHEVPLAVQQWKGLIAINYAARSYGITRHSPPEEALEKCPHLKIVHCAVYDEGRLAPEHKTDLSDIKVKTQKISLDYYRRQSLKILSIFTTDAGKEAIVEKASIDESFLDLTLPVRQLLFDRWPELQSLPLGTTMDTPLPPVASLGIDLEWGEWNLVPSSDGDGVEEVEDITWSDVALYLAAGIVEKCRKAVEDQLGYTCSAGVATNKTLAKLCSGYKKPNAQTILCPTAVQSFLLPVKISKIRNLGGKLGHEVRESFSVETVEDVLKIPIKELKKVLGDEQGGWVGEIVRGVDLTEVEAKIDVQSIISSKDFLPPLKTLKEVSHWLKVFSTELHLRLTEARSLSPQLWPKTLVLHYRIPNLSYVPPPGPEPPHQYYARYLLRSHQSPFPYTSNLTIDFVTKLGLKLVQEVGKINSWSTVRLSLTGLERMEKGQEELGKYFGKGKRKWDDVDDVIDLTASDEEDGAKEFCCEKCGRYLRGLNGEELEKGMREHRDWHFARSLVEKERKGLRGKLR